MAEYEYILLRSQVFSDEGQRMFLKMRDTAKELFVKAGACRLERLMASVSGDSWLMLACADRLVELGEAKYVYCEGSRQHWILVSTK